MLEKLCAAHGVSGNEKEIRDLLRALCLEAGAECTVDRVGNLICVKDGGDASAHGIRRDDLERQVPERAVEVMAVLAQ